ncbi:hypothetical protein DV735_g460, partial [Chaetothyriales sp. CBS 134920]
MPAFVPWGSNCYLPYSIHAYPQHVDRPPTPTTPTNHLESLNMPPQTPETPQPPHLPQLPTLPQLPQLPQWRPMAGAKVVAPANSPPSPVPSSSPPTTLHADRLGDAVEISACPPRQVAQPEQPEQAGPHPADMHLPSSPPPDPDPAPSPRGTARLVKGSAFPSSLPFRPRTESPSGLLVRPHSSGGLPLMQRAHSSPGVDSSGRFIAPTHTGMPRRPTSPLQVGRRRHQFGTYAEDLYMGSPSRIGLIMEPKIPEHEELELPEGMVQQALPVPAFGSTLPKPRRRVVSVLHQSASAPSLHARAMSPSANTGHSRSTSPSLGGSRSANEVYPASLLGSTSSMPSTPTSIRSRSPSISSLDTIEDSPDAEEQAMLEEEEARQKIGDDDGRESRRKSTGEARASTLRSNKERKRWSVCGAERRADFSLETRRYNVCKRLGCNTAAAVPVAMDPHTHPQAPLHKHTDSFEKHGLDDVAFGDSGAIAALRTFDAFPKTKASYRSATSRGGQWTVALLVVSVLLAVAELGTWWQGIETHHFTVERGVGHELQLNLDIVVAMPCEDLHVNVQDASMDRIMAGDLLTKEGTNFGLWIDGKRRSDDKDDDPAAYQDLHARSAARQREEEQDSHVGHVLGHMRSNRGRKFAKSPRLRRGVAVDACRIYGSLEGNKVQGDFHITARGHGYMEWSEMHRVHLDHATFNFSHHINELSFGPHYPGLLNPLDRTSAQTADHMFKFQYFVSIRDGLVHHHAHPDAPRARSNTVFTNQYAATSQSHALSHGQVPGIFVKYDIEPILLIVSEQRASLLALLVRLVNLVSGVLVGGGWAFQLAEWAAEVRGGRRRSPSNEYLGIGHRRTTGSMDLKVGLD